MDDHELDEVIREAVDHAASSIQLGSNGQFLEKWLGGEAGRRSRSPGSVLAHPALDRALSPDASDATLAFERLHG